MNSESSNDSRNDRSAIHWCNLGAERQAQGNRPEAEAAYRNAIEIDPTIPQIHYNLGTLLSQNRRFAEAISAYRHALTLNPEFAEGWNNLGNALRAGNQLDEAFDCFQKAILLKPAYLEAHNNLATAYRDQGKATQAVAQFRKAAALPPASSLVHSNLIYAMHFDPACTSEDILKECRGWSARFEEPLLQRSRLFPQSTEENRRLRIGYVSPDFRRHSAVCFLLPLIQAHHRADVEVFCYSNVLRPDKMTETIRAASDQWRDISKLSDDDVVKQIQADEIDILVDCTLHMARNRLLVFARRPAPIQITWLGYPSTTGLRSINYRLSDHYLDPDPAKDDRYTERTIRLSDSFWCYRPLVETPDVNSLPVLKTGRITFGSLNNFAKVSPGTISCWIEILRRVPASRLIVQLSPGKHREELARQFKAAGLEEDQFQFVPRLSPEEYFAMYQGIDIALDSFPYTGHTTTLDALWMGVPVVTLAGETAVSRGSASILANIGMRLLITDSQVQYVQTAVKLADDLPSLSALRKSLRETLGASSLMDADKFAGSMEKAFRDVWNDHCRSGK